MGHTFRGADDEYGVSEITVDRSLAPDLVRVRIDHDAHGDTPHKALGLLLDDDTARAVAALLAPADRNAGVAERLRGIANELWDFSAYGFPGDGTEVADEIAHELRDLAARLSDGEGGGDPDGSRTAELADALFGDDPEPDF